MKPFWEAQKVVWWVDVIPGRGSKKGLLADPLAYLYETVQKAS